MSRQSTINRGVVAELHRLEGTGILTPVQRQKIAVRYPTETWDIVSLVRVFTILGAISAGAGAVVLANQHFNTLRLLEVGLALAVMSLLAGARVVRAREMPRTAAAMEMGAGFAVQGFTTALAIDLSTGSKNWPSLVGIQTVVLAAMAYALTNRLVLAHAAVTCFVWFGGETGYVSGWGMYWLGMTYPMRFAIAGTIAMGVGWAHAEFDGPYQPFSRVYAHFGAFVLNVALWLMSIFGDFNLDGSGSQRSSDAELVAFTVAWALVSVAFIFAGARWGIGLLRSYGVIFLIINVYTFYFQFVAAKSPEFWFVHLLIAGGTLLALGFQLERWLRPGER